MLVAASTFCFWLSLYFYVPFLPLRALDLGATNTMLGAVIAAYAIAQVGLRIPMGIAADAIGRRKPFAVAALAASALGALGLAVSPDPWTLFAARAVTGIAGAGWVAITVLYSSYFASGDAARAMSRIMAVNAIALVLATFTGGILADLFGSTSTFYAGVVVGTVGGALMLAADEPPMQERQRYSARAFLEIARVPLLVTVSVIGIATQFVSFATSFGFVPVYAEEMGAGDAAVGYITTTMFAFSVVGTLTVPWMVARSGYAVTLLIGMLVMAVAAAVVPLTADVFTLGVTQALNGFGRGSTNALLITLAVLAVAPHQRATAMGVYQAVYAIGMLGGPVAAGIVADAAGVDAVFYLCAAVALAGGALVFARPLPRA
ncbi:MAG: MFS transporter [Chloroflexi bacterium]|nr:MFS transporter [Chloroflexota bacterium]MDA1239391.1 MFS transporter [Chloroflexota bacterium]